MPQRPDDRQRELGAFYTPTAVADHMAGLLRDVGPQSRLLEPAGGDGALAEAAVRTAGLAPQQVDVWDTNPDVAPTLERLGVRFHCRDSLLDAPAPRGAYTHALGNPPYLNKQSQYIKAHRAELRRKYSEIGAQDTYAMFTYLALEQLREGGQLVFLISDTFLTLGIHRALRELLLTRATLTSITLLPTDTFPGAAVRTAIVDLTKQRPSRGHRVRFVDARRTGNFTGTPETTFDVPQFELAANPGAVLAFAPAQREVLTAMASCPPLVSICDGGLGMWTRDNASYLAVTDWGDQAPSLTPRVGQPVVPAADIDGTAWRHYHKRGGTRRWWGPAEHCVRWDERSRSAYALPATAQAGETTDGTTRPGVIVSGVSTRLSARLLTPGAMWESNKAFGLFPRDLGQHPVEFLCAVLNSRWYDTAANALNHTVSLQWRDLSALPLLPFTSAEIESLAAWGTQCIEAVRDSRPEPQDVLERIDALVEATARRATRTEPFGEPHPNG